MKSPFLKAACLGLALLASTARAGVVAYWPFNDAGTLGNDLSGGGTVLTASGGAVWTATGKSGGGLSLNGTSSFLGGTVTGLPIGNSAYTLAAWFKPTAQGDRGIIGWGSFGTPRATNALRLIGTANQFRHYWWAADLDSPSSTTNFTDGNWHHVAATYDGTNRRLYLDGVQIAADVPGVNGSTNLNFRIGSTNLGEYFQGTLDDVVVYNNGLLAAEVASLASGGSPVSGPIINSFTANKATAYEGENVQLSWTVNTASVTGTFSYEIKNGATTLSTGTAASGTFTTAIPDLSGTAQNVTWTLRAIETGGGNVTTQASVTVAADPGKPTAPSLAGLTTPPSTPLNITLGGTDPNGGALSWIITTPPTHGSVTGTGPGVVYTPAAGIYGADTFSYKVSDGKYESAPATVRLTVLTPPIAPSSVVLDDLTIAPTSVAGNFLSNISSPDPNAGEAHTFTLVSGAGSEENGNFTISGHQLKAGVSFAALTGVPQRIRIRSTDSGGLTVEAAFILTVVPKARGVVINEVNYNPADNTKRLSFIELYNDGATTADLSGWRLSGGADYRFPAGTMLAAGGYLVVAEDPATISAYWGVAALGPWENATVVYADGSKETHGLSNDGANLRLRDATDALVSEVDYQPRSPWPALANGGATSMELVNPRLDEGHGSNWAATSTSPNTPTPTTYVPPISAGWKYFKGTTAPAASWFQRTGADLTGWLTGATIAGNATSPYFGFGYADNDDNPAYSFADMRKTTAPVVAGYQAVYFRHEFTIPAGQMPGSLDLRVYVDDGAIIYLNGVEIPTRFFCGTGTPVHAAGSNLITGVTFTNHEAAPNNWSTASITNLLPYNLVTGTNVIAILAANDVITSTDFSFNLELKQGPDLREAASPGLVNRNFAANAAPAVRNVDHTPKTPTSSDPIIITAKITDPEGVASASLAYQICTAGSYIPSTLPKAVSGGAFVNVATPLDPNPAFELAANWTTIPMNDDGLGDDALGGDGIWTATIPAQANRTLVRYRITAADNPGLFGRVPYAADPSLNFACFVYNGVPDYQGTPSATLTSLPTYHLLTRKADYDQCVAYNAADRVSAGASWTFENWEAAFVCDGVVYDHIPYRLHGANGRYSASGTGGAQTSKRSFKFLFNKGYEFNAKTEAGASHPTNWATMITENCWENRATYTFSLNEVVNFYIWNHLGVPSPLGNWAHFRTVMQTAEQPDAFHGDFWGLMYVHEDYDRRFLAAHDLKKGNLYKLTRDGTAGTLQFRYQSTFGPTGGQDHDDLFNSLRGTSTPAYITARVNLDLWCRYHAYAEAIRHYDYWPSGDNNAGWYFYPNYTAANGNRGQLWWLPNDVDATWGPTWNNGHDLVHNSLFNDSASTGGDTSTNPTLWPNYFNQVREIRRLLWQPDQVNPLIDQFAAVIRPFVNADFARWYSAPADAGNFAGLGGFGLSSPVGQTSLDAYVGGMKDFAFDADNNGSTWPGANVGVGGRAAWLDSLGVSLGEDATKYPATPAITFTGTTGYPVNDLRFTTTAFSDPQGAGTYAGIQWRMAEVNTSAVFSPAEPRLLEINASHDSGEIAAFAAQYKFPATACAPGHRYRARVRMKDDTGRWSFWSDPVEFTAGTIDPAAFAQALVVSEIMYHATAPSPAENATASALVPPQTWTDDDFDWVELRNVSTAPVDLTSFAFTSGFDFTFAPGTIINPGASLIVVQNAAAFTARYGAGKPVAGAWQSTDKLSNGGETIALSYGLVTTPVFSFAYNDNPALNWPVQPDGGGASLVRIAPEDTARNPSLGVNWRSSLAPGGSPGADDRQTFPDWLAARSESGANTDTDNDGLANLVEYALGGNPAVNNSATLLPTAAFQTFTVAGIPGTYAALTFQRSNAADDLTQSVQFSTGLDAWQTSGVQISSADNGNGTRTEVWRSASPVQTTDRIFGRVRFFRP